jgi:hypothetical protein
MLLEILLVALLLACMPMQPADRYYWQLKS